MALPESDVIETATDLDLLIIVLLLRLSFTSSTFLLDRKTDQNDDALVLGVVSLNSVSDPVPTNRDLDRRKGIATDLERRKAGSLSMRLETRPVGPGPGPGPPPTASCNEKREKEEEEDDEDDVVCVAVAAKQAHGRALAQSGQRVERRSRRHTWHIPVRRRLEGCLGHFHTSSSSILLTNYSK